MKHCVESRPFAPIQKEWLDSVVARIAPELREYPKSDKLLQELCTEVTEEFRNVIVKHTGKASYMGVQKYLQPLNSTQSSSELYRGFYLGVSE